VRAALTTCFALVKCNRLENKEQQRTHTHARYRTQGADTWQKKKLPAQQLVVAGNRNDRLLLLPPPTADSCIDKPAYTVCFESSACVEAIKAESVHGAYGQPGAQRNTMKPCTRLHLMARFCSSTHVWQSRWCASSAMHDSRATGAATAFPRSNITPTYVG
jgi:hypothetical protein